MKSLHALFSQKRISESFKEVHALLAAFVGKKKKTKDIYNNPHYLTKDQLDLIDFHKCLAIEINKIEIEITLFYSSGGHKYQKLSEFNEWYIKEYNINSKTIAEDNNIKNYGIESLMNLY